MKSVSKCVFDMCWYMFHAWQAILPIWCSVEYQALLWYTHLVTIGDIVWCHYPRMWSGVLMIGTIEPSTPNSEHNGVCLDNLWKNLRLSNEIVERGCKLVLIDFLLIASRTITWAKVINCFQFTSPMMRCATTAMLTTKSHDNLEEFFMCVPLIGICNIEFSLRFAFVVFKVASLKSSICMSTASHIGVRLTQGSNICHPTGHVLK